MSNNSSAEISVIVSEPDTVKNNGDDGLIDIGNRNAAIQPPGAVPIPARFNYTSTPNNKYVSVGLGATEYSLPEPLNRLSTVPEDKVAEESEFGAVGGESYKRKEHPDTSLDMGRTAHTMKKFTGNPMAKHLNFEKPADVGTNDIGEILVGMKALLERVLADNESVKHKVDSLVTTVDDMSRKMNTVDETVHKAVDNALNTRLADFENKMDTRLQKLEKKEEDEVKMIDELRTELREELKSSIQGHDAQRRDEETRTTNVMGKGLAESKNADPSQRKQDDITKIKEMAPSLFDFNLVYIKTAYRLGEKKGEEPRLIRVVFGSEDQRERFLHEQHAFGLAKEVHVSFWRDRTIQERNARKQLEAERDRRNENSEEGNWIIRGNKVVQQGQGNKPFRGNPREGDQQ